jgi:hypothetical protein
VEHSDVLLDDPSTGAKGARCAAKGFERLPPALFLFGAAWIA